MKENVLPHKVRAKVKRVEKCKSQNLDPRLRIIEKKYCTTTFKGQTFKVFFLQMNLRNKNSKRPSFATDDNCFIQTEITTQRDFSSFLTTLLFFCLDSLSSK